MFNTGAYLARKKRFKPKNFIIEGVEFLLMPLSDELIKEIKECVTSDDILEMSADYGLASDGVRAFDDDEMAEHIEELWCENEMQVDCEPSLKFKVGKKVCEISGLDSALQDMLESEEAARVEALKEQGHIDGDTIIPSINIDDLNNEAEKN